MLDIINFLNNYNEAIASINVFAGLIGCIIGYFIKTFADRKNNLKKENKNLKAENEELKLELTKYKSIEKTKEQITKSPLGGECLFWTLYNQHICPVCWYNNQNITPVFDQNNTGYFKCQICGQEGIYDPSKRVDIGEAIRDCYN